MGLPGTFNALQFRAWYAENASPDLEATCRRLGTLFFEAAHPNGDATLVKAPRHITSSCARAHETIRYRHRSDTLSMCGCDLFMTTTQIDDIAYDVGSAL